MTPSKRVFLRWFLGGLLAFAITLTLHIPLATDAVPGGIADHQRATNAATVNAIHAGWQAAGVYGQAHWAMATDLILSGFTGSVACLAVSIIAASRVSF